MTQLLLATGRFVGRSVIRSSGARVGLTVLPVKLPDYRVVIDIITIKDRTLSPLAKLFIDCARDVANTFAM